MTPSVTPTRSVTPSISPTPSITPSNSVTPSVTPSPSQPSQYSITICNSNASWDNSVAGDTNATNACNAVSSGNYCYTVTLIKHGDNNQSNAYPEPKDTIKESGQTIQGGYYGISTNLGGGPQNYYFTYTGTGAGVVDTPGLVLCSGVSPTPSRTPSTSATPSVTPSNSATPSASTSVTPSVTPSVSTTPSVTPSRSVTPTPSPSSVPLYPFDGGFSTVSSVNACDQANGLNPKTLKSTTQNFGTGTLQNGVSKVYDEFNNVVANKIVSNGTKHGTTNANGLYSDVGLCEIA